MNKIALMMLICLIHPAYGMEEDNPDRDVELAPITMVLDTLDAQREPLVPPATRELPQAAATIHQQQSPQLERPAQVPPINVHANAYMNSQGLERKLEDLTTIIKKKPNGGVGVDGSFSFAGSVCVGITLYCLFNGMKPTCNCTCPTQTVVCSFPTPRPTPLSMDNGTMPNSTQANMTTDENSTMPSSTTGFMQMFSTLMGTNNNNDTMPTLAPTSHAKRNKLKED